MPAHNASRGTIALTWQPQPNNKLLRPTFAESAAFGMNHFQPRRLPSHRRPQRSAGGAQRLDWVGAAAIRRTSCPHKTRKTLFFLDRPMRCASAASCMSPVCRSAGVSYLRPPGPCILTSETDTVREAEMGFVAAITGHANVAKWSPRNLTCVANVRSELLRLWWPPRWPSSRELMTARAPDRKNKSKQPLMLAPTGY